MKKLPLVPFGVYDGTMVCEAAEELLSLAEADDLVGQTACKVAQAFFLPTKTPEEQDAVVTGVSLLSMMTHLLNLMICCGPWNMPAMVWVLQIDNSTS